MSAPQKFRKKPVEITAYQWWQVAAFTVDEGVRRDVDQYRYPPVDPETGEISAAEGAINLGDLKHSDPRMPERFRREGCGAFMHDHGYIDTLEGGHTVCPGDWIITGVQGEKYPCKPDIFEATYTAVPEADPNPVREARLRLEAARQQLRDAEYAHLGAAHDAARGGQS